MRMWVKFLKKERSSWLRLGLCVLVVWACKGKESEKIDPMGITLANETMMCDDLPEISQAGVLIAGLLNGPQTYYDFKGRPMGLQYHLIQNFANTLGLELRVEVLKDTLDLWQALQEKKIDVIALPLQDNKVKGVTPLSVGEKGKSWFVRTSSVLLKKEINSWYSDSLLLAVTQTEKKLLSGKTIAKRSNRHFSFFASKKGGLSPYDDLFQKASIALGWDWKLLASICYQESAFDASAVSWAGARGLMQLMPNTAKQLGVSMEEIHHPEINVHTGARYLKQLHSQFNDIPSPIERIKFTIASYNGGYLHIRDAMSLAKKYHRNAKNWDEVAPFVLNLSQPQYYRDPVVKYGYMIGQETYAYVYQIMERWQKYGGNSSFVRGSSFQQANRGRNKNRFSRQQKIDTLTLE